MDIKNLFFCLPYNHLTSKYYWKMEWHQDGQYYVLASIEVGSVHLVLKNTWSILKRLIPFVCVTMMGWTLKNVKIQMPDPPPGSIQQQNNIPFGDKADTNWIILSL